MIRVTVWNEFRHEQEMPEVKAIYPNGIHAAIAEFLSKNEDMTVRTATLDEPEHGLTDEVLNNTDVLLWWGHAHHNEVSDEVVRKVCQRVNDGMGFIALGARLQALLPPARHAHGHAALARGRRYAAPVGHQPRPPHRQGFGRLL